MRSIKGRFAPSPSGRMHLGNVYAAMLSWLSAKSQGGEWLLRIEDLDPQRCRREYALLLEDDLRWLGLEWDEGGTENRGGCGPYLQSERGEIYEKYLQVLEGRRLTYPCYCTRADIMATQAPHESDGRVVYKGTCRPGNIGETSSGKLQEGLLRSGERKGAIRLYVPDEEVSFVDGHYGLQSVNLASHCGDFIIRRKDDAWAYQLAVTIDDALMGVTEVVRGNDLLLSAPQQIYIHHLLGFTPPEYIHHPLLCNEDEQRLSKRDKSLHMGVLREKYTAEQIIGKLAFLAGIKDSEEPATPKQLIGLFDWDKVPKHNILASIS